MTTPIEQIRDAIQREAERNVQRVVSMLSYVGEEVVNRIRTGDISNWIDRTGNLRSSIGYIITIDGAPVKAGDFTAVKGPEPADDKVDGSSVGKAYAQRIGASYTRGIALVVVAGMEYASYVEKLHNKVVLAEGEIEARKLVAKMIEKLNNRLGNDKDRH